MSVRTAFTKTVPVAGGRVSVAAVALLIAVAVLAGLLVGAAVRSKPSRAPVKPAETVSAAGVRLQLPSGWARGGASAVPGFDNALWLRNGKQDLRAAVALIPASSPTLLPKTSPADARAPETVRLRSGYEAWRYRGSLEDGSPVLLYATPTTTGIATVACVGANAGVACDALASAVAVPNSRRLKLDKRAAFFSGLPPVVTKLDAARTRGMRTLEAARGRSARSSPRAIWLARTRRLPPTSPRSAALGRVPHGRSPRSPRPRRRTGRSHALRARACRSPTPTPAAPSQAPRRASSAR